MDPGHGFGQPKKKDINMGGGGGNRIRNEEEKGESKEKG